MHLPDPTYTQLDLHEPFTACVRVRVRARLMHGRRRRCRMAAHWSTEPKYGSYKAALRAIVAEEGPRALWSGLWPTLVGIVPYAGLSFATYNTLKAYWVR
jgi:hypothetical protein